MNWRARDIQKLLGISGEDWRRLRAALPPLAQKDGRCDQYDHVDVIGLLIVTEVWRRLGAPAKALSGIALPIWEACIHVDWIGPSPSKVLAIIFEDNLAVTVRLLASIEGLPTAPFALYVALVPLTRRMTEAARHISTGELQQGELF